MKDDSAYRSLTEKPGWLQKLCERCKGNFWLAPGQSGNGIRYCKNDCRHEPPEIRFWKSVTKDGPPHPTEPDLGCCWNSKFTRTSSYPLIKINGDQIRCARFVLELTLGRPLGDGLQALHSCDNTRCVNPAHLNEGTQQKNIQECVERKRHVGNRILSDEQVLEIRALKGKMGAQQVGDLFGRPRATIYNIWLGYNRPES